MQIDFRLISFKSFPNLSLVIDKIFQFHFFPQDKKYYHLISAPVIFIISFIDSSLKNFPTGPFALIFRFFQS